MAFYKSGFFFGREEIVRKSGRKMVRSINFRHHKFLIHKMTRITSIYKGMNKNLVSIYRLILIL